MTPAMRDAAERTAATAPLNPLASEFVLSVGAAALNPLAKEFVPVGATAALNPWRWKWLLVRPPVGVPFPVSFGVAQPIVLPFQTAAGVRDLKSEIGRASCRERVYVLV